MTVFVPGQALINIKDYKFAWRHALSWCYFRNICGMVAYLILILEIYRQVNVAFALVALIFPLHGTTGTYRMPPSLWSMERTGRRTDTLAYLSLLILPLSLAAVIHVTSASLKCKLCEPAGSFAPPVMPLTSLKIFFFFFTETHLLACIVNYFSTKSIYLEEDKGVRQGDLFMSWEGIFQDIRDAVDQLHEKVCMPLIHRFVHWWCNTCILTAVVDS